MACHRRRTRRWLHFPVPSCIWDHLAICRALIRPATICADVETTSHGPGLTASMPARLATAQAGDPPGYLPDAKISRAWESWLTVCAARACQLLDVCPQPFSCYPQPHLSPARYAWRTVLTTRKALRLCFTPGGPRLLCWTPSWKPTFAHWGPSFLQCLTSRPLPQTHLLCPSLVSTRPMPLRPPVCRSVVHTHAAGPGPFSWPGRSAHLHSRLCRRCSGHSVCQTLGS